MKKRYIIVMVCVVFAVSACSKQSQPEPSRRVEKQKSLPVKTEVFRDPFEPPRRVTQGVLASGATKSFDTSDRAGSQTYSLQDIQTALKNAGFYDGVIDGKLGQRTTQAIKDFQKANNLTPDGKIGKKTWQVLSKYSL